LARDNAESVCAACSRHRPASVDELPADFWSHPLMEEARASRDMGTVCRAYRHHPYHCSADGKPLKQEVIAARVGVSQVQVCRIERGTNRVRDLDKLVRWALALGMPASYAWFELPEEASPGIRSTVLSAGTVEGASSTAEEEDVKRRTALAAPFVVAAAMASGGEPWQRIDRALATPSLLSDADVDELERETIDYFRREEYEPARRLASGLRHHTQRLARLLEGSPPVELRPRLLSAIGESLALYGWFAFDRNDFAAASRYYALAASAASDANDGPLQACILAYRSYLAEFTGNDRQAVDLLTQGQARVRSRSSAATRAWLAAREAEIHARLGQGNAALVALERALTAYDYARPQHERAWTAFFTPSRLGSMTVTAYTRLNHPELRNTADGVIASLGPGEAKVKAVILADVATAAIHGGDYDQGAMFATDALAVTKSHEASLGADRLRHLGSLIAQRPGSAVLAGLGQRIAHELEWHRR
jgi:transcriptional regulator with XRE-family HTH domain